MITFKIHQIKDIENVDYAFREYDPKKFNFDDYECQYEGEFTDDTKTSTEICEVIFYIFNSMYCPDDFEGRSLSMSDIIELDSRESQRLYYCDTFGWRRIKF